MPSDTRRLENSLEPCQPDEKIIDAIDETLYLPPHIHSLYTHCILTVYSLYTHCIERVCMHVYIEMYLLYIVQDIFVYEDMLICI